MKQRYYTRQQAADIVAEQVMLNVLKKLAVKKTGLRKLTPYQLIMRASQKLVGLKLSSSEVFVLSRNTEIFTRAQQDEEEAKVRRMLVRAQQDDGKTR